MAKKTLTRIEPLRSLRRAAINLMNHYVAVRVNIDAEIDVSYCF